MMHKFHQTDSPAIRVSSKLKQSCTGLLMLALVAAGQATAASTEQSGDGTVVRLGTSYENYAVSEGHRSDLEGISRARQEAQATGQVKSAALPKRIQEATSRHSYWHYGGIYFADIETHLYHDRDRDGFYTGFNLYFDVDAEHGSRWVYARIYLRQAGESYEFFHETHVFEIYDDQWSDGYEVETDLIANYEAGYYDVRIELYESGDAEPWDVVDASNYSSLRALPLESERYNDGPEETHIHEYAGSVTFYTLIILGLMTAVRRVRASKA